MALHRKMDALLRLRPDIAVVSECAHPEMLQKRGLAPLADNTCLWMGDNHNKGLGVFAFNGYRLVPHVPVHQTLHHILPVTIAGPTKVSLLAVWAQNASAGITRKRQQGPLRRALTKYRDFLTEAPCVVGGDWNSNAIWDKPGWQINHMTKVRLLDKLDLVSVYHALFDEAHGQETIPTHYWRDRTRDGPTYHIDYAFVPRTWIAALADFQIGSFDDWIGNGLSDHVPLAFDVALPHEDWRDTRS